MQHLTRLSRLGTSSVLAGILIVGATVPVVARSHEAASTASSSRAIPTKVIGAKEQDQARKTSIKDIERLAKAIKVDDHRSNAKPTKQGPDGPKVEVPGQAASVAPGQASSAAAPTAVGQNGAWPGAYNANPNRQVGKIYFDVDPGAGTTWSVCSGTVINTENKSFVLTAGHCVYSPDPDKNSVVNGNGFWHQQVRFCPGYESGCKLGVWYARQLFTTNKWFSGSGTTHAYDWTDDIGVILLSRDATRGLVADAVGSQGIAFNQPINLTRYAFGYPEFDTRWPSYSYNGQDLIYCSGTDSYYSVGYMSIPCTMTGGASGGPWIISPNASWLGYVNSVNSHKPWGGAYMGGPYFGQAEYDLFQYARNR